MTQEQTNTALLEKAYTAWHDTKGGFAVWMDLLADHISFGSLADGKPGMGFTKPRASKQEVIGYFEGLAADWTMEFYHINEYVAQLDRVVAIGECACTTCADECAVDEICRPDPGTGGAGGTAGNGGTGGTGGTGGVGGAGGTAGSAG